MKILDHLVFYFGPALFPVCKLASYINKAVQFYQSFLSLTTNNGQRKILWISGLKSKRPSVN